MISRIKQKLYNLLRHSEKYTKTDMVYLASGNFWLIAGRVIAAGSGIVLSIAFANLLPKETFGTYKYILSIAGFLGAFSLSGIGTAVTRAVAQGLENIITKAFWVSFRWRMIGSSLAAAGAIYYLLNGNATLGISLLIIAALTPVSGIGAIARSFLQGKKDFRRLALLGIPKNLIPVVSLIIAVFLTDNALVLVGVYFSANALASFVTYLLVTKTHKPKTSADDDEKFKETIRYAKHMSVMGFFSQAASQLDNLLLWHFAGPVQVAVYSFAVRPARELQSITQNIFPLAMPKFAAKKMEEVKKTLPLRMLQMALIAVPIVTAYILAAPYIFKFLFPQYMDSVFYSQLFSLVLLFQPKGLISTALDAHAKIKQKYLLTFSGTGLKLFFFITLIPAYGILGIILSFLLAEVATTIILIYLYKKL